MAMLIRELLTESRKDKNGNKLSIGDYCYFDVYIDGSNWYDANPKTRRTRGQIVEFLRYDIAEVKDIKSLEEYTVQCADIEIENDDDYFTLTGVQQMQDKLTESYITKPGFMNGQDLVFVNHMQERLAQRDIPMQPILATLKSVATNRKAALDAIPIDGQFVLRDPTGFGIAIQKFEKSNGTIIWKLITVHKTLDNPRGVPEIQIPRVIINPVLLKKTAPADDM